MRKITLFYGKECPHCHIMLPLAEQLSKEEKVKIIKLEVWHNKKNADKMRKFQKIITAACSGALGVPVFLDELKNTAFCGESSYAKLKKWSKKE